MFKVIGRIIKYLLLGLFAIAAMLIVAVFCFEQRVPTWALERISAKLSSDDFLVRLDSATFRLPRGVCLNGLRMLDRRKLQTAPFLSAERVELKLALGRLPWRMKRLIREIVVTGLSFPRLPDGYYIPDSIEFPGQPD
jgi:hypothetical protein